MTLHELGLAFKDARLRARLTQAEAAAAAGVGTLLVSQLERGALAEIGTVKLLALFQAVGLELVARRAGPARTLDEIAHELDAGEQTLDATPLPKRIRHARAQRSE